MNKTFKLVNAADYYQYDQQYQIWKDKSDDREYMKNLVQNGEDIQIVGLYNLKMILLQQCCQQEFIILLRLSIMLLKIN